MIENLVLQADGVSRDDDWLLRLAGVKESGHEIGERLSDAGGGFDAEVFIVVEGVGDGIGHINLLLPWLIFESDAVRGVGVPQGGIVTEKGFSLFFYHADKLLVESAVACGKSVRRNACGKCLEWIAEKLLFVFDVQFGNEEIICRNGYFIDDTLGLQIGLFLFIMVMVVIMSFIRVILCCG